MQVKMISKRFKYWDYLKKKMGDDSEITYEQRNSHYTIPLQYLDVKDSTGKEYCESQILSCCFEKGNEQANMIGYIRYSCGRFEVVCPFKGKDDRGTNRYILGINPKWTIIGDVFNDANILEAQMKKDVEFIEKKTENIRSNP